MFDNINTRFLGFLISVLDKRSEKGATATEYGLLVAFIAVAIIAMVTAFGTALGSFFTALAAEVGSWIVP